MEHDPEDDWWNGVVVVCRELLSHRSINVVGVGVSGIGPCVVPCDANDRPLRPAILYGIDSRASAEVDELTHLLGADVIIERCGSALSSQALGPKLLWLSRNEPDVWSKTCRWHMASTFVVARLTGCWVLDHHSASQCDPLYDLDRSDWNSDWSDAVAPGLPMPPLAWAGEIVGTVGAAGCESTGIPIGTPVIAGTIDAWAEAASVGVRAPGDLMLMYGSTMFLISVSNERSPVSHLWNTRGVDPGSLTVAAGTATAGSVVDWVRRLTTLSFDTLCDEASLVDAGSEGLLFLPYFAGERTPIMDPKARGVIIGLTLAHSRAHLYRAALEGIAFGLRQIFDSLPHDSQTRGVAVGGGTRDRLWPQIVSDVCGITQLLPTETIGASYGDTLLVAEALGLTPARTSWTRAAATLEPVESLRLRYDKLYSLYGLLYPQTRDLQHALSRQCV